MNNTDLQNISDVIAGKKAINVEAAIPVQSILILSLGVFLAVLFAVMLANNLSSSQ